MLTVVKIVALLAAVMMVAVADCIGCSDAGGLLVIVKIAGCYLQC